nr:hypothetical protein [Actinoplanes polyasparticus]
MPGFVIAQIVGLLAGAGLLLALYPDAGRTAGDVVAGHNTATRRIDT